MLVHSDAVFVAHHNLDSTSALEYPYATKTVSKHTKIQTLKSPLNITQQLHLQSAEAESLVCTWREFDKEPDDGTKELNELSFCYNKTDIETVCI